MWLKAMLQKKFSGELMGDFENKTVVLTIVCTKYRSESIGKRNTLFMYC